MKRALLISALPLASLSCAVLSTDFTVNEATTFCSADADCAPKLHTSCDVAANLCRTCDPGFGDCNGEPSDGCEVNLQSDAQHCNACGTPCNLPHAEAACEAGACKVAQCADGYADCDGDAMNGCEVDLQTDPQHCGTCSKACMPSADVKEPACAAGSCTVAQCTQGHTDCNGAYADGCETATATDVLNCGSCGVTCSSLNATGVSCGGGVCFPQCKAGFGSCGPKQNGCDFALTTDVKNCGSCGNACPIPPHAVSASCAAGACGVNACATGYGDCNQMGDDGCEVSTTSDPKNCGACNKACGPTSVCKSGACAVCALKILAKVDYGTGSLPRSVTVGDLNGDGKLDLAVANTASKTVSVLLGNGDGSYLTKVPIATGIAPHSVATGDLNGDGKLDVAVPNRFSNTINVFLGNGNGTFQNKVDFGTGSGPVSVAAGDLNGDGKLDLTVANRNSNTVSVLVGNGNGTFKDKVDFGAGISRYAVTAGDLNGDGKLDLAVANVDSNTVSVLLGNGNGTFQSSVNYGTGFKPRSVTAGDLNGDGKLDLAVANRDSNTVSVLLGNGNGTFQNKVDFGTGGSPISVTAGDLNGDGKLDLAVANIDSNTVSVLLGNGNGTFQNKVDYGTGISPYSVTTGDLNGDGKLDLAVANRSSNTVSVLLNGACLP
jgi:hypothetical protein